MARAHADPARGGSDWLREAFGLGRRRQLMFEVLACIGVIGTVSGWSVAYFESRRAPLVERIPLVYDGNLQLLGKLGGPIDPSLVDRNAVKAAMDWVRLYRSRSRDNRTMDANMGQLAALTAPELRPVIGRQLEEHRKQFGKTTIDVTEISGNLPPNGRIDEFRRSVLIHWTEVVGGNENSTASYSGAFTVAFTKQSPAASWGHNINGFFVTDAQISKEAK